jgi:GNAT superfamily N-acetyltransferase
MARATAIDAGDSAIRLERVDRSSAGTFTRVLAEGWSMDAGQLARVHDAMLAGDHHALFLAFVGGEPAGVASSVVFARSVCLLGGVVLPAYRRRGVYRALVLARLADAARRGIALATTNAREQTSAPILARMGFEPICRITNLRG